MHIQQMSVIPNAYYMLWFTHCGLVMLVVSWVWVRFLFLARSKLRLYSGNNRPGYWSSKLRLYSANHRPGYWSNLPCDWPSTAWTYSEQETENRPSMNIEWGSCIMARSHYFIQCWSIIAQEYQQHFKHVWKQHILNYSHIRQGPLKQYEEKKQQHSTLHI